MMYQRKYKELIKLFKATAREAQESILSHSDKRKKTKNAGQYEIDLIADEIFIKRLGGLDFQILSEEAGFVGDNSDNLLVIDPIDGSTNASRSIPFFASNLAVVEKGIPVFGYIYSSGTGIEAYAFKDNGAYFNGKLLPKLLGKKLKESVVCLSGYPERHLRWRQYRAFGCAGLEIALVANGALDAFLDVSYSGLGIWDYIGGKVIVEEAGGYVDELLGRDLSVYTKRKRRNPIVSCSKGLYQELIDALQAQRYKKGLSYLVEAILELERKKGNSYNFIVEFIRDSKDPYDPSLSKTHITASGIIVSQKGVILHKHKKLNKWMLPGGHIDKGELPWEAAKRECEEETGLEIKQPPGGPALIQIAKRYGIDGHEHYDLSYLLHGQGIPNPSSEESQEVEWFTLDEARWLVEEELYLTIKEGLSYSDGS